MTSARQSAVDVVDRVIEAGAYSNVLVPATVVEPQTDHRFFERLTFTTLRWLPGIDEVLATVSSRPLERLDRRVRSLLRVAAAEHLHLDGAPHAVVNEFVEIAKQGSTARASGFVNAVLRSLVNLPRQSTDLEHAYPQWLIDRLRLDLDEAPADRFLAASNGPAGIGVRHRPGTESSYLEPGAELPPPGPDVDIIDPASAAVAVAAGVEEGMAVLDVAAAPGGKTRAIADAVGHDGVVVATDIHERRLMSAARRPHTPSNITWMVADARTPSFPDRSFDRVVIDAPCSGLGTMRRRPEIRYRTDAEAIDRLAGLQRTILEASLGLVRPGGRLVYSVCTVTRRETIDVVAGSGFRPPDNVEGQPFGDGLLLGPHIGGTDGMFIAVRDA